MRICADVGNGYVVRRNPKPRKRSVVAHIYIEVVITRFKESGEAFFGDLPACAPLLSFLSTIGLGVKRVQLFLNLCRVVRG